MTLREVLTKSLEIIGEDIDLDGNAEEGNLKKLISCGNMIYGELTEEYAFLRHEEEVSAVDGKILYSSLSKPIKEVVRIKRGNRNLPYKAFSSYIKVGEIHDIYTVIYTYHGEELGLDGELLLPSTFTAGSLAAGVASEYFYRSGLIDEALFYKNRYDNTVLNLTRKRNPAVVCYRRFI